MNSQVNYKEIGIGAIWDEDESHNHWMEMKDNNAKPWEKTSNGLASKSMPRKLLCSLPIIFLYFHVCKLSSCDRPVVSTNTLLAL